MEREATIKQKKKGPCFPHLKIGSYGTKKNLKATQDSSVFRDLDLEPVSKLKRFGLLIAFSFSSMHYLKLHTYSSNCLEITAEKECIFPL